MLINHEMLERGAYMYSSKILFLKIFELHTLMAFILDKNPTKVACLCLDVPLILEASDKYFMILNTL